MSKRNSLSYIQNFVEEQAIAPEVVADKVATALYINDIKVHFPKLPEPLSSHISRLFATR